MLGGGTRPSTEHGAGARGSSRTSGTAAKIAILTTPVVATTFPVVANTFKGRFEQLSMSRFQPSNQNKDSRKNEKVDFSPLFTNVHTSSIKVVEVSY